jgi:hypothetical protein
MTTQPESPDRAWAAFVDGLREAGERLDEQTAGLDAMERADGFRALLRGLNNQLGRFEVDRERPELVAFNGWREKMFMDNPDFRYWVGDIRDDRRYRITGTVGDAVYLSITVYTSAGTLDAAASSRIDSDQLTLGEDSAFTVTLSREQPGSGDWLALPEGASSVWVRQFHHDVSTDRLGWCRIDPDHPVELSPRIDEARFTRHLGRLGRGMASLPSVFDHASRFDLEHPNEVRHWTEMTGGAAFTEPNIDYLRGSWQLEPDQALVVEGRPAPCRYWSILLYSRFLNSLDHRARTVSATDVTATLVDGRYRFVLAGRDPGGDGDWLDTEGRVFGIFVLRFLQPTSEPELPTVSVLPLADLGPQL